MFIQTFFNVVDRTTSLECLTPIKIHPVYERAISFSWRIKYTVVINLSHCNDRCSKGCVRIYMLTMFLQSNLLACCKNSDYRTSIRDVTPEFFFGIFVSKFFWIFAPRLLSLHVLPDKKLILVSKFLHFFFVNQSVHETFFYFILEIFSSLRNYSILFYWKE